jgi:hypothetical protein
MTRAIAEVSVDPHAKRRTTIALILKRAQAATNRRIATDLEIEESTLSRWRDDHLQRAVDYVLAIGCKVVPADLICIDARRLDALEYYAEIGMREQAKDRKRVLEWEE